MNAAPVSLTSMSDDELIAETQRLVACERHATAALLRSLGEIDSRRLYLREGCASLFTYCTQVLHLGEAAAYNRIEGARIVRRVPALLVAIEDGSLTLTTMRLLAPQVTDENCAALVARARHQSKRETEALVAALAPKPPAATIVRRLPERTTGAARPAAAPEETAARVADPQPAHIGAEAHGTTNEAPVASKPPARPLTPLSTEHYRLQVTLTREAHDKLRLAQDLLRHTIPSGDLGALLDRALTLLVEDLERRRCAAVATPRRLGAEGAPGNRVIPSAVRREVWRRDKGRCAFVGTAGRCRETGWLELHHVRPFADGGAASVENIELRCRAHNQYEARLWFESGTDQVRESSPAYNKAEARASCGHSNSSRNESQTCTTDARRPSCQRRRPDARSRQGRAH